MFLNADSIKKHSFELNEKEQWFFFKDRKVYFEQVVYSYCSEVVHSVNNVFEGKELTLELHLQDKTAIILSVDSNHTKDGKYQTLYRLNHELTGFRQKQIEQRYKNGDEVIFGVKKKPCVLVVKNGIVRVRYTDKPEFKALKVRYDMGRRKLILKGEGKVKQRVDIDSISDNVSMLMIVGNVQNSVSRFRFPDLPQRQRK
ncbi:MAG: hypothetical protein HUK40_11360 [Desulfobacter sp.]|nr:hypothetical protein [Desulfobacter sp.]WDP84066.1 MAG: hypothetical protein HUN05_01905 [Desulfobacter sp.]